MKWLINNWYLVIGTIAILTMVGFDIYQYIKSPSEKQLSKVKEWLLYAVVVAEGEFGEKTGAIKLRYVYDLFVTKFSWIAQVITFNMFSSLVDEALEKMKNLIVSNKEIKDLTTK